MHFLVQLEAQVLEAWQHRTGGLVDFSCPDHLEGLEVAGYQRNMLNTSMWNVGFGWQKSFDKDSQLILYWWSLMLPWSHSRILHNWGTSGWRQLSHCRFWFRRQPWISSEAAWRVQTISDWTCNFYRAKETELRSSMYFFIISKTRSGRPKWHRRWNFDPLSWRISPERRPWMTRGGLCSLLLGAVCELTGLMCVAVRIMQSSVLSWFFISFGGHSQSPGNQFARCERDALHKQRVGNGWRMVEVCWNRS